MKIRILFLGMIMLLNAANVFAQNSSFPDGGFENSWQQMPAPPAKNPYWDFQSNYFLSTLNSFYELPGVYGDAPLTAFREMADVHNGNYSLKLVSNTMSSSLFGTIFLPGIAGTVDIDIMEMTFSTGSPFTSRPTALTGAFKYVPQNNDSAAIEIQLKKSGVIIGHGKEIIKGYSNWKTETIPIIYTSADTPDSIVVIFASSAGYDLTDFSTLMQSNGQVGSALYVDDVEFSYIVPVTGINVSPKQRMLSAGSSASVTASVIPSSATNQNINSVSTNTAVATVNNSTIYAVSEGTANIIYTTADGGFKDTCVVTVYDINRQGIIRYVKPNGTGNGSSWANAAGNIQDMIDASLFNDQIWVAAGTYYPTARTNVNDAKSVTFMLKEGVHLYGGFAGNETSINSRVKSDIDGNGKIDAWEFTNETILSGNIDGVADDWSKGSLNYGRSGQN